VEHFKYGGEHLKLWLKKIFNRILALEDIPQCMKDGLVIAVYKRQGENRLLLNSYRGITISPVLCKIFETILLQRLSPILHDAGSPHMLQTAYQKGVSRSAWMQSLLPKRHYSHTIVMVANPTCVFST
jgi:hypothetical protein